MAHQRSSSLTSGRLNGPRPHPLCLEPSDRTLPSRSGSARSLLAHGRHSSSGGGGSARAAPDADSDGDGGGENPGPPAALEAAYRKAHARLVPLFMVIVGFNYIDRTSVAFAGIQMTKDLGFGPAVFGTGSGLFFLSYCAMQIPANLMCVRLGVTRWFTLIMLAWGAAAAAFTGVRTAPQFYALRLVLGAAEAGTFPGAWHALSLWLPPDRVAYPFALLGAAVAISQALAAPLSAVLLSLDGAWGLRGWQWVFLGEALPSLALACALPWLLPDGPHQRGGRGLGFLTPEELDLLRADHALRTAAAPALLPPAGGGPKPAAAPPAPPAGVLRTLLRVLGIWQLWGLALCNILKDMANMALMAWLPIMVQALLSGGDPTTIAQAPRPPAGGGGDHAAAGGADADAGAAAVLLSGIPFACAAAASTLVGAAMQRTGRPLHYLSGLNLAGGAAFVAFHRAVRASRAAGFACLVATLSCAYAGAPAAPWIVARLTAGPGGGAAVALPLFNSLAMLGGFLGPAALGALAEKLRGDFGAATALLGCSMLVAGALAGALGWAMARDPETRQIVAAKGGGGAGGGYETVASKEADPEAASP